MNAREVERELTSVLHRHAEDAMHRTDTHNEHQKLRAEVEDPSRRRRWVVGGVVAVGTAAAVVFALWSSDFADRADSGPVGETRTPAEAVAQRFVEAVAAGETDKVMSYLAPAERAHWRDQLLFEESASQKYLLKPCAQESTSKAWTTVDCPFDLHVLHSEQLGLGPFRYNTFQVRVKDGRVVSAEEHVVSGPDSSDQLVDRILSWLRQNHPGQFEFMSQWNPESLTPAEKQRWSRLWKVYSQEYADEMTQTN